MLTNVAREDSGEARELRALFETQLKELYWAEKVMIPMQSWIIGKASSPDLTAAFEKHRIQTVSHVARLEKIFAITGIDAEEQKYAALECLMSESESFIENTRRGVVRDAGIIAACQKIKHYEIACYGTMRAYAIALREEEAIGLLEETLNEEKETDLALSAIAESHINIEAADKEI
jgi:ferritin-like metal-binding protein YciE